MKATHVQTKIIPGAVRHGKLSVQRVLLPPRWKGRRLVLPRRPLVSLEARVVERKLVLDILRIRAQDQVLAWGQGRSA